ncbi:hypothetical protein ACWGH2_40225 [Streptomyces sp. NPDC054871]
MLPVLAGATAGGAWSSPGHAPLFPPDAILDEAAALSDLRHLKGLYA